MPMLTGPKVTVHASHLDRVLVEHHIAGTVASRVYSVDKVLFGATLVPTEVVRLWQIGKPKQIVTYGESKWCLTLLQNNI